MTSMPTLQEVYDNSDQDDQIVTGIRAELNMSDKLMIRVHPECPNKNPILAPAKMGDVGYDLKIWLDGKDEIEILPQRMTNIRTGVFIKLPENTWGDIRSRSSTFFKRHLFVMGGTIDEGYTGEISIVMWNPTLDPHKVKNGDRLAQLVVVPKYTPDMVVVDDLPNTSRGSTGFGSTGEG